MELKDIIKLIDAGFTKEEINALNGAEAKEEVVEETVAQQPEPEESKPEEVAPEATVSADEFQKLSDELAAIKKQVQASNLRTRVVDTPKQETIVDMLASLVSNGKE